MLGLDNPIHIAFILVLLLLVFGAKRLPEMGKSLGEGLRGFRDSISGEHHETPDLTAAHTAVHVDEAPVPAPVIAKPATEPVAEPTPERPSVRSIA